MNLGPAREDPCDLKWGRLIRGGPVMARSNRRMTAAAWIRVAARIAARRRFYERRSGRTEVRGSFVARTGSGQRQGIRGATAGCRAARRQGVR
jgi:hypothetical protein